MSVRPNPPTSAAELRQRAEARVQEGASSAPERPETLSPEAVRRAFHELGVHEIELEMQNEELRRVQAELDAARARYFDLYDLAPVGYCTLDAEGTIREANLTAATLLGVPRPDLPGAPLSRFVLPADQDAWYLHRRLLLETGEPQAFEARMIRPEGEPVWVWLSGAIRASEGDAGPVIRLALMDISRRKAAEAKEQALRAQLDQAERLEAIGTLAGGVAHDFNNILAGILGWLSVLELGPGSAEATQEDIREVKGLVERGAVLAKQLLGFARRGKYDVRPLDLAKVAAETGTLFGRTRPDVALDLDLPPGLPPVLMDHVQLEQVLLNLFVNAGQAMPDGGRIRVTAEPVSLEAATAGNAEVGPGRYLRLRVTDSGAGMDATTRARIFEPFFTTKGMGKGTGLGLASVYGIVKNHGGAIEVESAPGQGTTFTLLLPTAVEAAPRAAPAAENPRSPGRGTLLVVDDESAVLRMNARLLEGLGYVVLTASGGREAVELVRQHGTAISLVILDMTMPEMSGSQTFDALRDLNPDLKVLLASGYSVQGKAQQILDRGCNGFIQKPFDTTTLSAKLAEIL